MLTATHRLLRLLSLLQTRSHWSGRSWPRRWRCIRARCGGISTSCASWATVHASSGIAGGYALRPGKALPPLLLDDEEALAVAITLRTAAAGSVGGIEETALRALINWNRSCRRACAGAPALRAAVVPLEPHGPTVDAALLARWRRPAAINCGWRLIIGMGAARPARAWWNRKAWRTPASAGTWWPGIRRAMTGASSAWTALPGRRPRARTSRRVPRLAGRPAQYVSRTLRLGAYPAHARIVLHAPRAAMAARIPSAAGEIDESTTPAACCVAARRLWTT